MDSANHAAASWTSSRRRSQHSPTNSVHSSHSLAAANAYQFNSNHLQSNHVTQSSGPAAVPAQSAHTKPAPDPVQVPVLPQMALTSLHQMSSSQDTFPLDLESGRSTPSAYNPQISARHLLHQQQLQQQQQQQQHLHHIQQPHPISHASQRQSLDLAAAWNQQDLDLLAALAAVPTADEQQPQQPTNSLHSLRTSYPITPSDIIPASHHPHQPLPHHDRRASANLADFDTLFLAPDIHQATSAVEAPNPEEFELELERAFADADINTQITLNTFAPIDFTQDQFLYHRSSGTYSVPGAFSIVTGSSESGYGESESYYNPYSPPGSVVNAANNLNFSIDEFSNLNFNDTLSLGTLSQILAAQVQTHTQTQTPISTNPPISINTSQLAMPSSDISRSSYDRDTSVEETGSNHSGGSAEERDIATGLPGHYYTPVQPQSQTDARKKYQCPSCPRAFARAFNLKTHMATHDPNRVKPYTCSHANCNRSFSRKHDLGRHLISIHKDEAGLAMSGGGGSSARSTIGVPGHPLPQLQGRVHRVGGEATQKNTGAQTPLLPNIPLKREPSAGAANGLRLHPSLDTTSALLGGYGMHPTSATRSWCDTCRQPMIGSKRVCGCTVGETDSKIKGA